MVNSAPFPICVPHARCVDTNPFHSRAPRTALKVVLIVARQHDNRMGHYEVKGLRLNKHARTEKQPMHNQQAVQSGTTFQPKARCIDKVYKVFRHLFTAVDDARICNGSVLLDGAHEEKDTSVHYVGRHGSNACIF